MKRAEFFVGLFNFLLIAVIVIILGIIVGVFLSNPQKSLKNIVYKGTFSNLKKLEDIQLVVPTAIFDDEGNLIKEFAIERRKIAKRDEIPDILKESIIVAEDNIFYSHWGINIKGVIRAVIGVLSNNMKGGGSSITQQLVLNLFLKREKTLAKKLKRKFKEMLLAIQVERNYTKDEILTYYCNKIFWGKNIYGVKSAYKYYFGKSLDGLPLNINSLNMNRDEVKKLKNTFDFKVSNIADAAFIAGIIPSPNNKYDLLKHPENCRKKRNIVLKRLYNKKIITEKEYVAAIKKELPKIIKNRYNSHEEVGSYFLEEVRKRIENSYGDNSLYKNGLKVYTTVNMKMQAWAENALKKGLRAVDKRMGWKSGYKLRNLLSESKDLLTTKLKSWKQDRIELGRIVKGIVLRINNKRAIIKIGEIKALLKSKDANWTRNYLTRIMKKGDVGVFKIKKIEKSLEKVLLKSNSNISNIKLLNKDKKKILLQVSLEREPEPQGAIIVIENKTGMVKAMVGGYSFSKSKWNNAIQAKRQVGSTIKPIIYTAALLNGYTPSTIIDDEPFTYEGPWAEEVWEPHNHGDDYVGPITFRRALEQSRNVVTARITQRITPERILSFARKFGIAEKWRPYISISLGAFEESPIKMAAAFTVFSNRGKRVEPYFISMVTERNGSVINKNEPQMRQIVSSSTAFVTNYLLQGVVLSGTGFRARYLANKYKIPIGAKTGTTNDYTNAWFIGFTPKITVAVWVGYDKKVKSLGNNETGSRAAGPIFVNFLKEYLKSNYEKGDEILPTPNFTKPKGVIMVMIDKYTGKLLSDSCLYPFLEAYIAGKEPNETCSEEDHENITNYYSDGKDE